MSDSGATGCSTAVDSQDNPKSRSEIVTARLKKCICKEIQSDCQYLNQDLKTMTRKIIERQPEAGNAVWQILERAHAQLAVITELLENNVSLKDTIETLLLENEQPCEALKHKIKNT